MHDSTTVEAAEDESYLAPSAASVIEGNFVANHLEHDEQDDGVPEAVPSVEEEEGADNNLGDDYDEEHEYTDLDDDDDEGGSGGAMDEAAEAMAFMMAALGGGSSKAKAASPSKEKPTTAASKSNPKYSQQQHHESPVSTSLSHKSEAEEPIDLPAAPIPATAFRMPEVAPRNPSSTPLQRSFSSSRSSFEHEQSMIASVSHTATAADTEQILVPALLAYVNYRCKDGMTALHLATAENHAPTVGWLLSLGADAMLRNALGERPLFTACKLGHTPCVRLLRSWRRASAATCVASTPSSARRPSARMLLATSRAVAAIREATKARRASARGHGCCGKTWTLCCSSAVEWALPWLWRSTC